MTQARRRQARHGTGPLRRGAALVGAVLLVALGGAVFAQGRGGRSLHSFSVGRHPVALAVDGMRHRAYVVDRVSSTVDVLDLRTGAIVRQTQAPTGAYDVLVDPHAGRVFVRSDGHWVLDDGMAVSDEPGGTPAGGVQALTVLDSGGVPVHTTFLDTRLQDVVSAGATGLVLLAAGDAAIPPPAFSGVIALDAASGSERFRLPISEPPEALTVDPRSAHALAYLADGSLLTIDLRGGRPIRLVHLPQACVAGAATPALAIDPAHGRAFLYRSDDPCISVVDARSGALVSTRRFGCMPVALLVDAPRGRVLCIDAQGGEVVFDAVTGAPYSRGSLGIGNIGLVEVDPDRKRAYAVYDGAAIAAIDATGRLIHAEAIDTAVTALGIDDAGGYLVVGTGPVAAASSTGAGWLPSWLRQLLQPGTPPLPSQRGSVRELPL